MKSKKVGDDVATKKSLTRKTSKTLATTSSSMKKQMKPPEQPKVIIQTVDRKAVEKDIDAAVANQLAQIGKTQFTCSLCGKLVDVSYRKMLAPFYKSHDPHNKIGYVTICRDCIEEIVYKIEHKNGKEIRHAPTPDSIREALEYMDKPWFRSIYEDSVLACQNNNSQRQKTDAWQAYIDKIQTPKLSDMRWKDGETEEPDWSNLSSMSMTDDEEAKKVYEQNKRKVLHDLGYDPFATADDEMRPLMFNKLSGYLDDSTADDQLKLDACIELVQSTAQAEKYNYSINYLQRDPDSMLKNLKTIKDLGTAKKDAYKNALDLAKANGISAISNNTNSKGGATWSGQVKALREGQYRFGEVNNFDIGTAEGMAQVAKMNAEALMDQVRLDDSDYADMVVKQREIVEESQNKCDAAIEEARILKRENKDLKDYLRKKGLIDQKDNLINPLG